MARLLKSSMLVCLALLCQVALGSPDDRDSSSSSITGESQPVEGSLPSPAVLSDGRVRTYIFSRDRPARPNSTNPFQPARTFAHRWQAAAQSGGRNRLPRPDEPAFPADSSRVGTTDTNTNRNAADVIYRLPEPAGTFGSSVSTTISENDQPSGPNDRRTQSQASNNNPTRPSSSFPVVVVQPNQSNGNSPPVRFFPQSNQQSGQNIPVASGGVEPQNNFVTRDQFPDNVASFDQINPSNTQSSQGSFNGGVSPNRSPSQNTNTNFGPSTGSFNGGGSPNTFPSRNSGGSSNAFPSQNSGGSSNALPSQNSGGSSNALPSQNSGGSSNRLPSQNNNNNFGTTGGSPSGFPFQNTNDNFGSSTGSFNGGNSQQPSTGSVGLPAKGFPTNNVFQGSDSTNQFPNDKFGGSRTYPEIFQFTSAIQDFTLDLLATFRVGSQNNVVYSPVSIASLLSLLTLATNGNSKREVETALFPLSSSSSNDHHNKFEILLERLNHRSQGITISTSSRLFLEQSVNISGTFTDGAMKHYNCSVSLENFSRKPEQTMKRVNSWVEEETRGKITKFVDQPFNTNTMFVAANTIYFDGKWAEPFLESITTERDFDTGNEMIQIPMMNNIIETPHYYSRAFNVDVTSLLYSGGQFAMIIILPRESPREKSIMDLEKQLNTTTIESLVNNLASKQVSISLPKMKLAMKTSLVENLSELRIRSIFSPNTADFSSLSNTKPLYVSEFLHEAVMEVTEAGTVAAAASAVGFNRMGHQIVMVNKPAIIFIRDMATRVPLFWTRLVKPERVLESEQKKAPLPTNF